MSSRLVSRRNVPRPLTKWPIRWANTSSSDIRATGAEKSDASSSALEKTSSVGIRKRPCGKRCWCRSTLSGHASLTNVLPAVVCKVASKPSAPKTRLTVSKSEARTRRSMSTRSRRPRKAGHLPSKSTPFNGINTTPCSAHASMTRFARWSASSPMSAVRRRSSAVWLTGTVIDRHRCEGQGNAARRPACLEAVDTCTRRRRSML